MTSQMALKTCKSFAVLPTLSTYQTSCCRLPFRMLAVEMLCKSAGWSTRFMADCTCMIIRDVILVVDIMMWPRRPAFERQIQLHWSPIRDSFDLCSGRGLTPLIYLPVHFCCAYSILDTSNNQIFPCLPNWCKFFPGVYIYMCLFMWVLQIVFIVLAGLTLQSFSLC